MAKVGKTKFEQLIVNQMKHVAVPVTLVWLDEHVPMSYLTIRKMLNEMEDTGAVNRLKSTGRTMWVLPEYRPTFEN